MSIYYTNIIKNCELFYYLVKNAMHVHDRSSGAGDCFVVAFGPDVWLFNNDIQSEDNAENLSESEYNSFLDMIEKLDSDYIENKSPDEISPSEILNDLAELRPDILQGEFNKNKKELFINSQSAFRFSPTSSILIKKVLDALGGRTVAHGDASTESNETVGYGKYEILGRMPDSLYHGTSLSSAIDILRLGLMPKPIMSNYKKIVLHDKFVFLTSLMDEAKHHAHVAARNKKENNENSGVVFSFKIPDKSKIRPDYDVDVESSEDVFQNPHKTRDKNLPEDKDSFKLSREFGLFGYEGRIPASFIDGIFFIDQEGNSHNVNKEELLKIYENGGEYYSLFWEEGEDDEDDF